LVDDNDTAGVVEDNDTSFFFSVSVVTITVLFGGTGSWSLDVIEWCDEPLHSSDKSLAGVAFPLSLANSLELSVFFMEVGSVLGFVIVSFWKFRL
jgi:hypothetical protein